MEHIEVTKSYYKGFKEKYRAADDADQTHFAYRGKQFYTRYAMYMIEYIESEHPEWKEDE